MFLAGWVDGSQGEFSVAAKRYWAYMAGPLLPSLQKYYNVRYLVSELSLVPKHMSRLTASFHHLACEHRRIYRCRSHKCLAHRPLRFRNW